MTAGQGSGGTGPVKSTSTPAVVVILAIITMIWSVACGCVHSGAFMFTYAGSQLHTEDQVQLEKDCAAAIDQAEIRAIDSTPDPTEQEHIRKAYVVVRQHMGAVVSALVRVSTSLKESGVHALFAGLTFCNLPFLISAILLLGRRRIGRTLLIVTATAILLLIAAVMFKLGGPIESVRANTDDVIRGILASTDAAALPAESRTVLEQMPKGIMLGLTAVNFFAAITMAIWPLIALMIGGLSKKVSDSCDQ